MAESEPGVEGEPQSMADTFTPVDTNYYYTELISNFGPARVVRSISAPVIKETYSISHLFIRRGEEKIGEHVSLTL